MVWSDVSRFQESVTNVVVQLFMESPVLQQLTALCFLGVRHSQRCRYIEAHAVHKKLNELEALWGERCTDELKFSRIRTASEQRARIVVRFFLSCLKF